ITDPISWSAHVTSPTDILVRANLYYFPGWTSAVDDQPVQQQIVPESGEIQFRVPAGEHHIRLEVEETRPRNYGELISLIALIVLLSAWALPKSGARPLGRWGKVEHKRTPPPESSGGETAKLTDEGRKINS